MSFSIPKKLQKKVNKEIRKTFTIEKFDLIPIHISEEIRVKLSSNIKKETLFKIVDSKKIIGYAFVDKAPSKTDLYDFLILLNTDLIIVKTKVLIYREDYGSEIGSKRWLKQFIGKSKKDRLYYGKDIMAISGATISANSMTRTVNQFLLNVDILHQNKVL